MMLKKKNANANKREEPSLCWKNCSKSGPGMRESSERSFDKNALTFVIY